MAKHTFNLSGLHCQSCVQKVGDALRAVLGVSAAEVSLNPPRATIEFGGPVATEALAAAVRSAGAYALGSELTASYDPDPDAAAAPARKPSLYPLALIVGYIAGIPALIAFALPGDAHAHESAPAVHVFMNHFMAGFFLVFSFFKLLDLRGFVSAYASYDLLAREWPRWGFIYPFIELALGVAYLLRWQPTITNSVALALMLFGSLGVLRALMRRSNIRCACLGTALNLPMTTVTLVEDVGMAAMAAAMLLWP